MVMNSAETEASRLIGPKINKERIGKIYKGSLAFDLHARLRKLDFKKPLQFLSSDAT